MTSRRGVAKRRGWEERLRRHRASGLTVTRFCANEGVSVKAFYYSARRVRTGSPKTTPVRPNSTAGQGGGTGELRRGRYRESCSSCAFTLTRRLRYRFPRHCVDAIRCLAECVQQSRREHSDAFREVVVSPR